MLCIAVPILAACQGTPRDVDDAAAADSPRDAAAAIDARPRSCTWSVERIAPINSVLQPDVWYTPVALAVDVAGHSHVAYCDGLANNSPVYATDAGGSWSRTTIGTNCLGIGIALDGAGHAHVAYGYPSLGLRYATNASGAWVDKLVAKLTDGFGDVRIAIDSKGSPRIVHFTGGDLHFLHPYDDGTGWGTDDYTFHDNIQSDFDLVLDELDQPHISVRHLGPYYLTKKKSEWLGMAAGPTGDLGGKFSAIARDSAGNVYISSYEGTAHALHVAVRVGDTPFVDAVVPVSSDDSGYYTSVAVTPDNRVHLIYFDNRTKNLRHVTNETGGWATELVDDDGNTGRFGALVARGGVLRVAYLSAAPAEVRVATRHCL